MANLARVRCIWGGLTVTGGGVSTHYFAESGSGWTADLITFYEAIKGLLPTGTTISVPGQGDLIDVATGEISGAWTDTAANTVVSNVAGGFASGTGCRIQWFTAGIRNGRRVVGSTFIVPLLASSYMTDGALQASVRTTLQNAAQSLLTDSSQVMHVYSRPHKDQADGQTQEVTSPLAPNKVSTLRSRRT